jgi:hypothetical protein
MKKKRESIYNSNNENISNGQTKKDPNRFVCSFGVVASASSSRSGRWQ